MVIDTSALLAILKVEPEALDLIAVLSEAGVKWISTATLLETRLVVERHIGAANLGDCFSYGLARALEAPLLFKGDDFAATDLEPVRLH
ncbi:MAG: type II toxin-antitoxin system VapC family toxin [Synechococcaceae cyanobacterium]|jgi:ribonuclease VapC